MAIRQQAISLQCFAQAMREEDSGFAGQVSAYEAVYGPAGADRLGVLAQAAYYCWFEQEYARDFLEVCRAIGSAIPTTLYLCNQITPQRWDALHAYVVEAQQWLGCDWSTPAEIDCAKIARIADWLGERTSAKTALVELFLYWFIRGLRHATFSVLAGDGEGADAIYQDYAAWYTPFAVDDVDAAIAQCKERIYQAIPAQHEVADTLISKIVEESQPACMHRYTRYQDIKLASIGALCWRGYVPPDTETPRDAAKLFFDEAVPAVQAWLDGISPESTLAQDIYQRLGEPTAEKRAIVQDFMLTPKVISDRFFYWIAEQDQETVLGS